MVGWMKVFFTPKSQNLPAQKCLQGGVRGLAVLSVASPCGPAPSLPAWRGLPGGTRLRRTLPAARRHPAWPHWEERGLQMAGHLAAQEAVWAGAPCTPPRPTRCFLFLCAQRGRWGLWCPRPLPDSGSHLGSLAYVASGPGVPHVVRSVIRSSSARPGGL